MFQSVGAFNHTLTNIGLDLTGRNYAAATIPVKILFLVPYPLDEAPSQRFRFELFFQLLQDRQFQFTSRSFLESRSWKKLYDGHLLIRAWQFLFNLARRCRHVISAREYDIVFIHRELAPVGPPVFEWFIAKILRKKIIYDFDDAIWLPDPNETNRLWQVIKWKAKVRQICRWSWKVSAGNSYLAAYAQNYCSSVHIIPTVVNTRRHTPAGIVGNEPVKIGWTGTHTTLPYLTPLIPVLAAIEKNYSIHLIIIANLPPSIPINYQFIKWSKATEVTDLQKMDIGLMPLTDDQWSQGKCGFKAIQYGAIGIPSLVSPVGVNKEVVIDRETGIHCHTPQEWYDGLVQLIESESARKTIGEAARAHIVKRYSVQAIEEVFVSLFTSP